MEREKVIDCLCERMFVNNDYPVILEIWDELTILLSENVLETIDFLNDCTEEQMFYISEIIEDISYNVKSQEFIDALYKLCEKYPNLKMESDVILAESYMEK